MTHPLLANIATYGFAALAGDVLMQSLEGEGYDAQRTARYGLYHVLFTGTYRTAWLAMLGAVVPAAPLARAAVTKTALDCFVSTPLQHFAFISYMAAFDGCGWDGTLARCKRSAWYHAGAAHRAGWTPGCHRRNLARGIYTAKQHAAVETVVMVSGTQRVSRLPFLPQELWHAIIGAAFALRAA